VTARSPNRVAASLAFVGAVAVADVVDKRVAERVPVELAGVLAGCSSTEAGSPGND